MRYQSEHIMEFTLIYNQHKTRLYNYVLKMIYDKMVCDDIIQNTFIKLYENMDRIQNKDSIKYWLYTTARNEVYSFFRSKKIKVDQFYVVDADEVDVSSGDTIDINYEQMEIREIILSELNKMSIDQRDVYLLKEYGRLSYREIALMLEITEELVKSRLHKTRQKLIKKITPLLT